MFTNRGSTISPTTNKFNVQCVGHDNCHQLVFQVIVEFVETTIRKTVIWPIHYHAKRFK